MTGHLGGVAGVKEFGEDIDIRLRHDPGQPPHLAQDM